MTYVVTEACIKCKYTDCVEVCPVNCFHEGATMVVIDPEVCIDCGVCEPECPINAIQPAKTRSEEWVELNATYSKLWPSITHPKAPLPDAEKWAAVQNKYPDYFTPEGGEG